MTLKNIIKATCAMLNREDVLEYLNDTNYQPTNDTLSALNIMVSLVNLVIGELAGTFIPMVKTETMQVKNGKVKYADLSERCVKVVGVLGKNGEKLTYKHTPEFIVVSGEEVSVCYEYIPPNYGLDDEIGYAEDEVSVATLSYGLSAEYAISKGNFDEAVMWHERFVNSVASKRKLKNSSVKARSFV